LAVFAFPPGAADLAAFSARQTLAVLDFKNEIPTAAQWRAAQPGLERAIALDPGNPSYHEALARWHERYTLRLSPQSEVGAAYREQARVYLRRALARRPSSPYTWANLAIVHQQLGIFDGEFQAAILHAGHFGPWEPEVQLGLAYLAFTADRELSEPARAATRAAMANAVRRYDKPLFDLAAAHRGLALLCTVPGITVSPLATRCI